jgi:hypothetical protein
MSRSFRWLVLGAVVLIATLVGPTVALADNCGDGSATSIYTECLPTANGKPKHHQPTHKTPPANTTTQPTYTYTYTTPVTPTAPQHVTQKPKHRHRHHHHPRHHTLPVSHFIRTPGFLVPHQIDTVLTSSPTGAATVGSEFDLGSGPTILLALLLGSVLALVGTGGVRSWRNRHRA